MHHTYTYTSCDNQTPVGSILAAPCQPILSETEGSEGSDRIEIREMPGPRDLQGGSQATQGNMEGIWSGGSQEGTGPAITCDFLGCQFSPVWP